MFIILLDIYNFALQFICLIETEIHNIIPHLNNLLIFNSLTKQNVYPSRQKIREFVRRHQFEIDRELLKKRKKAHRVIVFVDTNYPNLEMIRQSKICTLKKPF